MAHKAYKTLTLPSIAVISGWVMVGVGQFLYPYSEEIVEAYPAPEWIHYSVGGTLIVASILVILSSAIKWRNDSTSWQLELIAHPLLVAAWLTHSMLIFYSPAPGFIDGNLSLAFAVAAALRFVDVNRSIIRSRRNVEYLERRVGGNRHVS